MRDYLRLIDTTTRPRCDVTPLFADHEAFSSLIDDLVAPFAQTEIDCVAGIDALGFIIGAAMALRLKTGLVTIRKGGKLPAQADAIDFVDYTGQTKSLELRTGTVKPGMQVLLVDEWIETGAQVAAAIGLIEQQGGIVAGIATINIDDNTRTQSLRAKYRCHAVWRNSNTDGHP